MVLEKIASRFLSDAEDVEANADQVIVIEEQSAVEQKRRLLHRTVDQFVVEFLREKMEVGREQRSAYCKFLPLGANDDGMGILRCCVRFISDGYVLTN